jgi:hypothetical protein
MTKTAKKVLARPSPKVFAMAVKPPEDCEDNRIRAEYTRIQMWLNGFQTVEYVKEEACITEAAFARALQKMGAKANSCQ